MFTSNPGGVELPDLKSEPAAAWGWSGQVFWVFKTTCLPPVQLLNSWLFRCHWHCQFSATKSHQESDSPVHSANRRRLRADKWHNLHLPLSPPPPRAATNVTLEWTVLGLGSTSDFQGSEGHWAVFFPRIPQNQYKFSSFQVINLKSEFWGWSPEIFVVFRFFNSGAHKTHMGGCFLERLRVKNAFSNSKPVPWTSKISC